MATVTFKGEPVELCGDLPKTGEQAPKFGGVKGDLTTVHLPDFLGKKVVLNIFPSLDTPVCAASVRRFNKEASSLDNTVMTDGPLKGLLARAVVIVDEEGRIIYEELVPEITSEPDYASALKALK